jgi:uncharacterized membrane protein (DUF106 family)
MDWLVRLVVWLNGVANAVGSWVLAPIGVLPGWLSATIVAAVTGILLLIAYKYTSNQRAIKRVKDDIKANLLALKLFKDSASVALRAQGRILVGACRLLILAVVPMLVMVVPVLLVLGQLGLWYQFRPLRVGEDAVLTVELNGAAEPSQADVQLAPTDAIETLVGPVRVPSKGEICWKIRARANGYYRLVFHSGDWTCDKELAIGDGIMRVSELRPGRLWSDCLLHPAENPFAPESQIQAIEIDYPKRVSWTSGADWWVIYWFVVSMLAALCFRRVLNVNF